jgi:hypothetical protein
MKKPDFIPNYYSYELTLNNEALSDDQKHFFFDSVNKIYRENDKFVYRGDKKEKLQAIYNVDPNRFEKDFYHSFFIMGAKANMLLQADLNDLAEIDIASAEDNVFRRIFRMLRNLLEREFPFGPTRYALGQFRKSEDEVTNFFREQTNEDVFIERINGASSKQKIIIRDYYLALLHHISKSEYYQSSFLLSTTLSFAVAHKFAWNKEPEHSENPVILFGWIPKNYEGVLSVPDTLILRRKINMKTFNLPVYERSFFHYQQEITLKGGLLPHYLLGYLHYSQGREVFAINPALFNTNRLWNGIELPIDQSSFNERLQNTLFGRYFTIDSNDQFRQH